MTPSNPAGAEHVTNLEIAAYLDRALAQSDLDRVEAHLAACADCRENLLGARGIVRRVRRPRQIAITTAVAVTLAAVLLVPTWRGRAPETGQEQLRGAKLSAALIAYGPLGSTASASPVFVWGRAAGAATYRLTVSRDGGESVWSESGTDTARVLPDSVRLRRGTSYRWVVDALLDDGTARSTGLREFQIDR